MRKLKGSFVATGSDGQDYDIEIYVDVIDVSSHSNPNSTIEGVKHLQTVNGLHVNRIAKGEYMLVQSGLKLHSDSPDAP